MCRQVLSLMLEQTGLHLGSYPAVPFQLTNWTSHGHHCLLDKTPDRMLDIQVRLLRHLCSTIQSE